MTAGRQRFRSRSLMFDNISYEMISFSNSGGRVLTKSHKYDISYEDLSLFGVPPPRVDLPLQVRLHIPANLPTANTSFHLPKMSALAHSGISPNIPLHRVDCIYSSDCGMQIVVEDSAIPWQWQFSIFPCWWLFVFVTADSLWEFRSTEFLSSMEQLSSSCFSHATQGIRKRLIEAGRLRRMSTWSQCGVDMQIMTQLPQEDRIYKVDGSNRIQLAHTESGKLM